MYQPLDEHVTKVKPVKTTLRCVTSQRQVAGLYRSPKRKAFSAVIQALALSVLLAGGTIYTIQNQHPQFTRPAALLEMPGAVIRAPKPSEDPFRISQVLRRYTRNPEVADRIAKAVVAEGRRKKIDPSLLVGVMLVESSNLNPRARSFVGATGLMQVMPFHRGRWGCKSKDLYNIESNICHGVSVLADAIKHAPNLRVALQRYNGCVRGTNTPGCGSYWGKVLRAKSITDRQLLTVSDRSVQQP